jgi:hypothetical protein
MHANRSPGAQPESGSLALPVPHRALVALPPPSPEQEAALRVWRNGGQQVCSAAAGSGKSTLLLHACLASDEPVLLLTYNKQLQLEMAEKLRAHTQLGHECLTFHGLCSKYLRITPDDDTMHEAVEEAEAQTNVSAAPAVCFHRVGIDEAQDMKAIYWRLLRVLVPATQWLLVGDEVQMLNDFDEDDPALLDFMRAPWRFFGGEEAQWHRTRLSTSFRLSGPVAAFVNAMLAPQWERLVAGNLAPDRQLPVRVYSMSNWRWVDLVLPWIHTAWQFDRQLRLALLVSNKRGNPPLRLLVNALAEAQIPLYVHGHDAQRSDATGTNPVAVTTWHAAKGMECDACIVLGVDDASAHNPLHVALSRCRVQLLVVQNAARPHAHLCAVARALPPAVATPDRRTMGLVAAPLSEATDSAVPSSVSIRDLTAWEPRGRAVRLHATIRPAGGALRGPPPRPPPNAHPIGERVVDTAPLYKRAALMQLEHEATRHCRVAEFMVSPRRIGRAERDAELLAGSSEYSLDARVRHHDALPASALRQAQAVVQRGAAHAADYITLAVCAAAWGGFHHALPELLPSEGWAEEAVFAGVRACLLAHLPDAECEGGLRYDQRLTRVHGGVAYTCRCACSTDETVWSVVSTEAVPRGARVAACVPLALHPTARRAVVLNVQTGESSVYMLDCKDDFLTALDFGR